MNSSNILNESRDLSSNSTISYQCREWTITQHNLYQISNIFFASAFLIPNTFKQSILIIRLLVMIGYIFTIIWVGSEVCAFDILIWAILLAFINFVYTIHLIHKFLPPSFTMELADLYAKVFRPLRVSQKHFKELVESAEVLKLSMGDVYASENITPANEFLSILLKGCLKITYKDFHLHYVYFHQFIDSPEWQANHSNEMDNYAFQVSIVAQEECLYLCWHRAKLEKVLKHRPALNFVFQNIVGKDITNKLYCLNENMAKSKYDRNYSLSRKNELLPRNKYRSQSVDVVNTSLKGNVTFKDA